MRISDWSSDVCSSDLDMQRHRTTLAEAEQRKARIRKPVRRERAVEEGVDRGGCGAHAGFDRRVAARLHAEPLEARRRHVAGDRKSVVSGTSVSVRVVLCGRRIIKKKKNKYDTI